MPPKNKKEVKKIQQKVVDDKTFGLKNKNKSKVVQQFVSQVTEQAKQAGLSKAELARQEQLRKEREAKKAEKVEKQKEEILLFNPAAKKKLEQDAKKKKEEEEARLKAAAEGPEIVSSEEAYLEAKRASDLAAAEAVLGPQQDDDIYDMIEKERTELKKSGKLTPVTFDSFVAWKAKKAEEKKKQELDDAKKAIAAASKMKGKSGRDLFNQLVSSNADLFLDDDDADDDWMKRDEASDDEQEVYDVQVTGTSLSLKKVDKPAGHAQAEGESAAKCGPVEGSAGDMANLAAGVDASLFLNEDVELPSDDDDD